MRIVARSRDQTRTHWVLEDVSSLREQVFVAAKTMVVVARLPERSTQAALLSQDAGRARREVALLARMVAHALGIRAERRTPAGRPRARRS